MPNFTPRPWLAHKGVGWLITRPDARERREAAIAVGTTPATTLVDDPRVAWFDDGEAESNAYLMAAAPDMYDALVMCVWVMDNEGKNKDDAAYVTAREALAKARGENA